ncbi:MAG: phosphoenolpyruvate carboxykinase (GTP), partial [Thermoleophilaceae bacterium]|nr:phosphoenolpyruvate carboxykinase (GTP) [Thermoleophilaceae bacterium]
KEGDLNTEGLDIDPAALADVLRVDEDGLREQLPQVKEHLDRLGDSLPPEVRSQFEALEHRLAR